MDELAMIREAFPAAPDPDVAMLAPSAAPARRCHPRRPPSACAVAHDCAGGRRGRAPRSGSRNRRRCDGPLRPRRDARRPRRPGRDGDPHGLRLPRSRRLQSATRRDAEGDHGRPGRRRALHRPERTLRPGDAGGERRRIGDREHLLARSRRTLEYGKDRSHVEFALPHGGTRTLAWTPGQGSVDVTDRFAGGNTSQTTLHSGDVVPLLPDTLDDQPVHTRQGGHGRARLRPWRGVLAVDLPAEQ